LRAANLTPEAEEAAGTFFARQSPGGEPGDKRVRVVWHTQGSGKSLTMAFYAGRLILYPAMENPTMTGSAADPADWQPHIRNKTRREALANRFRDASDPFRIVIVRDMWLTGFDAPSLHTMYVDKPMRGHGADAGHRPRQSRIRGQTRRLGCR
jgi:type I site-specific restriction-modification system R (restriction) subunit